MRRDRSAAPSLFVAAGVRPRRLVEMLTPKERLLNDACKMLACWGLQGNEPLGLLHPLCRGARRRSAFEPSRNISYSLP
jgi:hypothetical protein